MTQPVWAYPPPGPAGNDFGQLAGPVHLPSLTDAERTDLLSQMRPWVAQLVSRFHIDARVIPPCWERHNGMIEALSALRDLERDCFHDKAPPSAGVDWFRGFREIEARLMELASLTSCTAREHRDPPQGWAAFAASSRPSPTIPTPNHDDDDDHDPGREQGRKQVHDQRQDHWPAVGAPPVDVT